MTISEYLAYCDRMPFRLAKKRLEACTTVNTDGTETIDLGKFIKTNPKFLVREEAK